MGTIKSYTDLSQSKKLAKILPFESADMHYVLTDSNEETYSPELGKYYGVLPSIPCWSLASLLDILNKAAYFIDEGANVLLSSYKVAEWDLEIDNPDLELFTETYPVDACYEMILKIHELNLL